MRLHHIAQADHGRRRGDNDAGVFKTDNRNESADTGHNRELKIQWNRFNDGLPDSGDRQNEEHEAGNHNCGAGGLPGQAHGSADVICEVRGNSEARRHNHRIVGNERNHQCTENCRPNGSDRGVSDRHPCVSKHAGDHDEKITNCEICRDGT